MALSYWQKQTADQPLFENLLWSRPENRQTAGKLLIVGGNKNGFASVAASYAAAQKAGAGSIKVLLPDSLRKVIGQSFEAAEFAPATPSGGLAKSALAELLDLSGWADGTLLAGDFGHNAEVSILLEGFIQKTKKPTVLSSYAVDYFLQLPSILERSNICLVLSLTQLQKIITKARFDKPITHAMDLVRLIELLHELTSKYLAHSVTLHDQQLMVASRGQVSTTRFAGENPDWQIPTAARAVVWWLQNPKKPFEALTSAVLSR